MCCVNRFLALTTLPHFCSNRPQAGTHVKHWSSELYSAGVCGQYQISVCHPSEIISLILSHIGLFPRSQLLQRLCHVMLLFLPVLLSFKVSNNIWILFVSCMLSGTSQTQWKITTSYSVLCGVFGEPMVIILVAKPRLLLPCCWKF